MADVNNPAETLTDCSSFNVKPIRMHKAPMSFTSLMFCTLQLNDSDHYHCLQITTEDDKPSTSIREKLCSETITSKPDYLRRMLASKNAERSPINITCLLKVQIKR